VFLDTLADGASIARACQAAGIARSVAYHWRSTRPDFRDAWDQAIEDGTDRLEDSLFARAIETSDVAAIFLLKARRPQYRDPRPGVTALSDSDLEAVQQARRLAEMPPEAKQRQIDEIIRRRQLAIDARREEDALLNRGNGRDHC
jgi:hypothetical protein